MELDKTMDAYRQAFEAASTQEEQDAVSEKFASEIDAAFEAEESTMEQLLEEEQAEIEAQKKADADALAALEAETEKEFAEKDEFDPKAGEPMKSDVAQLSQAEFRDKYKVKDIQTLADEIGVETRAGGKYKREATLVADIYKALS